MFHFFPMGPAPIPAVSVDFIEFPVLSIEMIRFCLFDREWVECIEADDLSRRMPKRINTNTITSKLLKK